MCFTRKLAALLAMAESSETGRLMVLRNVIEAAKRAHEDVCPCIDDLRPEELIRALADDEEWIDDSQWIAAFERRLAEVSLPSIEQPAGRN
jgi:hypothetical protein